MARRNAVVRKLPAVETLGSTTVICSDKTGTLTENQMTVQAIVAGRRPLRRRRHGVPPDGEIEPAATASPARPPCDDCLIAGVLCNDAALAEREGGMGDRGDPTEVALLVAARKAGVEQQSLRASRPGASTTLPFEAERQYMATLHEGAGPAAVIYVKGAVERILAMSGRRSAATGAPGRWTASRLAAEADRLGARGLRVLAFARAECRTPSTARARRAGGIADLPRAAGDDRSAAPGGNEAVARCRAAGIAVKMITGDHVATATARGRPVRARRAVGDDARRAVLRARRSPAARDAELRELADRAVVFARVSPEQKLRLVEALQRQGEIVAMTGDGVNDAPALRQADIGVAMGLAGTEVARESADIVLTDDNFASIEAAVEEGRRIFDNLTKFVVWTLPTNMAEGLLILVAIALALTLPIVPVQILWINMTTAGALGLMLAFERNEPGIMVRPPRDPARPLLTRELIMRILLVSAVLLAGSFGLFEWAQADGLSAGGADGGREPVRRQRALLPAQLSLARAIELPDRLLRQPLGDRRRVGVGCRSPVSSP